ncbi:hypothetical protein BpHYR1_000166 [Brachionus plicatilis]|uniref:Uncharacterized protein n=1 Tax=Brachionus plicatilis TaxID=10195 RepID=A0A3M7SF04_BRAPC|nr:hypothetical protein BpHYR1_000166 [Brachionus plicatilis]
MEFKRAAIRHYETLQKNLTYRLSWEFFFNCVFYWTQTFFKGIALFKSSSERDARFSLERYQTTIAFFNFIGQFLPFFDYSDMSLTWTLNFVKIVIFRPFSTIVACRISRKSVNWNYHYFSV